MKRRTKERSHAKLAVAAIVAVILAGSAIVQIRASTAAPATSPAVAASTSCETLASLALPHAKIESAADGGGWRVRRPPARGVAPADGAAAAASIPTRSVPAFCRVARHADADERLRHQGRSLAAGVGLERQVSGGRRRRMGRARSRIPRWRAAVRAGYATASTDTGHTGGTADFALGHPEKLVDFGYRAIHETTAFGQADHRRVLRARAEDVVLQRLLDRRTAGDHRSAALSERLRRDRRRRVGVGRHAHARAARRGQPAASTATPTA